MCSQLRHLLVQPQHVLIAPQQFLILADYQSSQLIYLRIHFFLAVDVVGLFVGELEVLLGDDLFEGVDLELDLLLEFAEGMDLLHSFAEQLVLLPDHDAESLQFMGD